MKATLHDKISTKDLPAILKAEGIELRRSGYGYQFLCPFHSDKHPSGSLYNKGDRWRWKCFGCGENGDVVDFVQKRHGLDFRGACRYLGIESGPLSRTQQVRIRKNKHRRKITDTFTAWELAAIDELRDTIFMAYRISSRWKTFEDFERGAMWLDPVADLQNQLDILMAGNQTERVDVFRRWLANGNRF